ncbi:MAG: NINE protein [Anaerovibrio sp.]|nr:NINE protein [Anaerovibrio sp.]
MFCRKCGEMIPDGMVQCPKCGAVTADSCEVRNVVLCVSAKKKNVTMLLCLVSWFLFPFGLGGLHRLYVGRYKSGMLYNIFFGGFIIGIVYDFVKIWTNSFKDNEGFPIYSDSPLNSAYKRRKLRVESIKEALIYGFGGFFMYYILVNIITHIGK